MQTEQNENVTVNINFGAQHNKVYEPNIDRVILEVWDDHFFVMDPISVPKTNETWTVYIYDLPKNSLLHWRAIAYNSNDNEVFRGEITTNNELITQGVSIPMQYSKGKLNHPPKIEKLIMPKMIQEGETGSLELIVSDQDSPDLNFSWWLDHGNIISGQGTKNLIYQSTEKGVIHGTIAVHDGYNTTKLSFKILVTYDSDSHLNKNLIPISGIINDAKNHNLLKDVTLSFKGKDIDLIKNGNGETLKTLQATNGLVCFFVDPQNSSNIDFQFRVIFEKKHYLMTSKEIFITDNKSINFEINMVPLNKGDLDYVDLYHTKSYSLNGKMMGEIQLGSNTMTEIDHKIIKGGIQLRCQDGTLIKDVNGNIITGALDINMSYHNPMNQHALEYFPGGLDVIFENNNESNGTFISGGFTAIEISNDQGQKVRSFSKPIEINMRLDPKIINPLTKSYIQNGDTIPIWSYSSPDASWKPETTGFIQGPNQDGTFNVSFEVGHLSYWNLDWVSSKNVDQSILHVIDQYGNYVDFDYSLELSRVGGGYKTKTVIKGDGYPLTIARALGDEKYNIKAYNIIDGSQIGELSSTLNYESETWSNNTLVLYKKNLKKIKIEFQYFDTSALENSTPVINTTVFLKSDISNSKLHKTTNLEGMVSTLTLKEDSVLHYDIYHRYYDTWVNGNIILDENTLYSIKLNYNSLDILPEIPSKLTGDFKDNNVIINWKKDLKAKSYKVFYSPTQEVGLSSPYFTCYKNSMQFKYNQKKIYIRIMAENEFGESELSDLLFLSHTILAPTESPNHLTARADSEFILLWWDSVLFADSYILYRSSDNQVKNATHISSTTTTFYLDKTINSGQTYFYWVAAKNAAGNGPISIDLQVKPVYYTPQNISFLETSAHSHFNQLHWDKSARATCYELEWKSNDGEISGNQICQLRSWCHLHLNRKGGYLYRVRGIGSTGYGPFTTWTYVASHHVDNPVIFVDQNITLSGNGYTWDEAYKTLSDIPKERLSNVDIWITKGIHMIPNDDLHEYDLFHNLKNINIYGGFEGHETTKRKSAGQNSKSVIKTDHTFGLHNCTNLIFNDLDIFESNNYFSINNSDNIFFISCNIQLPKSNSSDKFTISESLNINFHNSNILIPGNVYKSFSLQSTDINFYSSNLIFNHCHSWNSNFNFNNCTITSTGITYKSISCQNSNLNFNHSSISDLQFYTRNGTFLYKNCDLYDFYIFSHAKDLFQMNDCHIENHLDADSFKNRWLFNYQSKLVLDHCNFFHTPKSTTFIFLPNYASIHLKESNIYQASIFAINSFLDIKQSNIISKASIDLHSSIMNLSSTNISSSNILNSYCNSSIARFEDTHFNNVIFDFDSQNKVYFKNSSINFDRTNWVDFHNSSLNFENVILNKANIDAKNSKLYLFKTVFNDCTPSSSNCFVIADSVIIHDDHILYSQQSELSFKNSIIDIPKTEFDFDLYQYAYFKNCLWLNAKEFYLSNGETHFQNSIIKTDFDFKINFASGNLVLNYVMINDLSLDNENVIYKNCFWGEPSFLDESSPEGLDATFFTKDDGLQLMNSSDGIGAGQNHPDIKFDITGTPRNSPPNLGPYESPY